MSPARRARFLLLGVLLGMACGYATVTNPTWVLGHPGTVAALIAGACLAAALRVQLHMNRFERGHEQRAEAFRLAMLAQYAPHLLPGGDASPTPTAR